MKFRLILFWLIVLSLTVSGQTDTLNIKHRKLAYYTGIGGIYTSSMAGLWHLWYAGYANSAFHWFDDRQEWFMVDKAGHCYGAYQLQKLSFTGLRWTGKPKQKAVAESAVTSFAAFATIEFFDGLSEEWGASPADLLANTAGIGIFSLQQIFWDEQRIKLKFSYWPGNYAHYRPDLLGKNHAERLFKDYNAQTYWLSVAPGSFGIGLPQWLAFSIGYGASGMLGGKSNPAELNGISLPYFERKRQFYLSPDINFGNIKTKHQWLKFIFYGLDMIKLPLPAIELSGKKIHFHALLM